MLLCFAYLLSKASFFFLFVGFWKACSPGPFSIKCHVEKELLEIKQLHATPQRKQTNRAHHEREAMNETHTWDS